MTCAVVCQHKEVRTNSFLLLMEAASRPITFECKSTIVWGLLEQCHDKRPGSLIDGGGKPQTNICLVKEIYMKVNRDEKVGKCSGSLLPSTTTGNY